MDVYYNTLKKSLSIVKLRSFQNASIEIKHIPLSTNRIFFLLQNSSVKCKKKIFLAMNDFFYSEKKSSNYVRIAFLD